MKNVVIFHKNLSPQDRKKKSPAPSKDQNPLGGCVLPKMRVAMGAGFGGCHDQKTFPLGFMDQTWLFPSITQALFIDGTFIICWDIYFSVTPGVKVDHATLPCII